MKKNIVLKVILLIVLILLIILFSLYCLLMSFVMLNSQVNDWIGYNDDLLYEIPLERTNLIADCEAWHIVYKFPLVPYARVKATYVDDGRMTKEELKTAVEKVATQSDKKFGGNKSRVIIEHVQYDTKSLFYVQIIKRCRSWYSIFNGISLERLV